MSRGIKPAFFNAATKTGIKTNCKRMPGTPVLTAAQTAAVAEVMGEYGSVERAFVELTRG